MKLIKFTFIDLLESLSSWLEKYMHECKPNILISYMITLGYVNYAPSNMDNIIKVTM